MGRSFMTGIINGKFKLTRFWLVCLAFAIPAFYFLYRTRAMNLYRDSLLYALAARTGQGIFHPHHLLFVPIIRVLYLFFIRLGISVNTVWVGQIYNISWAIATVLIFLIILKKTMRSQVWLLGALALFFSRGFLELATQTTFYVPALGSLALVILALVYQNENHRRLKNWVFLFLSLVWAILIYQGSVLILIPLAVYFSLKKDIKIFGHFLLTGLLVVLLIMTIYWLCFNLLPNYWLFTDYLPHYGHDYQSFMHYLTQYKGVAFQEWGNPGHLKMKGLFQALASQVWNIYCAGKGEVKVLVGLLAILLGLILSRARKLNDPLGHFRLLCLVWLVTYFVFSWWWLPRYQHPFLLNIMPIWFLAGLILNNILEKTVKTKTIKNILFLTVLVGLVWLGKNNFQRRILVLHRFASKNYLDAARLAEISPPDVFIQETYETMLHLRYYFNRDKIINHDNLIDDCYGNVPFDPPGNLYLTKTRMIINNKYLRPWYKIYFFSGYRNPAGWLRYMAYLFDWQTDKSGQVTSGRYFKIIHKAEDTFVLIEPSRIKVANWEEFIRRLEQKVNYGRKIKEDDYSRWFGYLKKKNKYAELKQMQFKKIKI